MSAEEDKSNGGRITDKSTIGAWSKSYLASNSFDYIAAAWGTKANTVEAECEGVFN